MEMLVVGTGGEPCATPPATSEVQLPFEEGFVGVSVAALAVSCSVELVAGMYSASLRALGGSFTPQVYMALSSRTNPSQKWTRRQISKGKADTAP